MPGPKRIQKQLIGIDKEGRKYFRYYADDRYCLETPFGTCKLPTEIMGQVASDACPQLAKAEQHLQAVQTKKFDLYTLINQHREIRPYVLSGHSHSPHTQALLVQAKLIMGEAGHTLLMRTKEVLKTKPKTGKIDSESNPVKGLVCLSKKAMHLHTEMKVLRKEYPEDGSIPADVFKNWENKVDCLLSAAKDFFAGMTNLTLSAEEEKYKTTTELNLYRLNAVAARERGALKSPYYEEYAKELGILE